MDRKLMEFQGRAVMTFQRVNAIKRKFGIPDDRTFSFLVQKLELPVTCLWKMTEKGIETTVLGQQLKAVAANPGDSTAIREFLEEMKIGYKQLTGLEASAAAHLA